MGARVGTAARGGFDRLPDDDEIPSSRSAFAGLRPHRRDAVPSLTQRQPAGHVRECPAFTSARALEAQLERPAHRGCRKDLSVVRQCIENQERSEPLA